MDNTQLQQIVATLTRHEVPCLVIGGHAVNAHGFIRATEDTDVICRRTSETVQGLLAALTELNAKWIGDEIDAATGIERVHPVDLHYVQSRSLMMLITDAGFLDVFDYVPGLPEQDLDPLFEDAMEIEGVQYVSLAWLRKMKQAAGRIRDQLDLEELPE